MDNHTLTLIQCLQTWTTVFLTMHKWTFWKPTCNVKQNSLSVCKNIKTFFFKSGLFSPAIFTYKRQLLLSKTCKRGRHVFTYFFLMKFSKKVISDRTATTLVNFQCSYFQCMYLYFQCMYVIFIAGIIIFNARIFFN